MQLSFRRWRGRLVVHNEVIVISIRWHVNFKQAKRVAAENCASTTFLWVFALVVTASVLIIQTGCCGKLKPLIHSGSFWCFPWPMIIWNPPLSVRKSVIHGCCGDIQVHWVGPKIFVVYLVLQLLTKETGNGMEMWWSHWWFWATQIELGIWWRVIVKIGLGGGENAADKC